MTQPRWDAAKRIVRYEVAPFAGEAERVRELDLGAAAQALAQRLTLALPVNDEDIRSSLANRRVPVSPGEAELAIAIASVAPGEIRVVPDGVETHFAVRGSARVDVK
jgi:hypothetical protein